MRARQLRDLTDAELTRHLEETRQELFNLRFQSATGALENSARLRLRLLRARALRLLFSRRRLFHRLVRLRRLLLVSHAYVVLSSSASRS